MLSGDAYKQKIDAEHLAIQSMLVGDFMGGGIDGRFGISSTLSSQQSSDLGKTRSELRQTFSVVEKYRRELEFLQKGGNPLDLKPQSAASVGVQCTSLTDQHPEQFVTSDAKGSFAVTASTHGDSVGSSVRLGALSVCEPNNADNLVLTDGDNKFPEVERRSIAPLEHFSQLHYGQNARQSGDSAALELPKKSYKRRIRSRPNNDGVRSSSSEANVTIKNLVPNSLLDAGLDGVLAVETTVGQVISTKVSRLCTQNGQNLDVNNENKLPTSPKNIKCNGIMEKRFASNEVPSCKELNNLVKEKEREILNSANNNFDWCLRTHNVDGSTASETAYNVLVSASSVRSLTDISEQSSCSQYNLNLVSKEHEEYILKEAQIIEAKRKTIAESSASTLPLQNYQNSHWDLVLEEMSWLANDFAQERLWKVNAAAQISWKVAFTSQIRYHQQKSSMMQKVTAQTMCRAVTEFWQTIEVKSLNVELQPLKTDSKQGLQGYAMRFLEYNSTHAQCCTDQVPPTPDMISDMGIIDIACDDNLTQENLFYTVPPGAVEAYKKSIESHLPKCETTFSGMQEEVDTSGYDAIADNAYEEDDEETGACYFPGAFEGSRASKPTKKRRKNFKFYTARSYETGSDFSFAQSNDKNSGTQPSVVSGKRSASSLNVSLPIKHVRTAFGQRVVGPFSGDIKSSQEEKSTLDGGAQIPNNLEARSTGYYGKQLQMNLDEVSDRPRKKKKSKHPGSSFDHQRQLDSKFQNDQKDHLIRRLEAHQLDSIGRNGLYIQHNTKKLKIRQSFDHFTPMALSIPFPVMSPQMSNMSNPKKFMESLVCRKSKTFKISAGQPGSGIPWSLFEDQSLLVLVHDMGPNWELISDAINCNLQFKCVVRSSKECKERHRMLMDGSTADAAADSAQDSGLSQPYPSTLPGIPEGSARQLFQRLQGPMEEATLKSHFEKIIVIGQKQYRARKQNENQDPKQLQQPHCSHALALSQVSPNNLNGGPVLTPLDLCDAIASIPDVPAIGYQSSHSGGLPVLNHGNGVAVLPGSSSSSSNLLLGKDFSSASVPLNPSMRDVRYGIPKRGLLPQDDQQRMQQYNQMSSKNMHLSPGPGSHSGSGRGAVGMLPNGNNTGVMSTRGMNKGVTTAFHGFAASPSVLNMHSRAQGSSMLRPRNSMHLMRNSNHQRQVPQISPCQSSQGVPQFAANTSHPSFGMQFPNAKERPQQQQFATSNATMSREQPLKSQFPVSSPENTTQKHPLLPPHGLMLNPQISGNQILKQQQINNRLLNSSQMQAARLQHKKPDNFNHQKLVNLSQQSATKKLGHSQLLVNSSEPHTSKLQISPPQTSSAGASS